MKTVEEIALEAAKDYLKLKLGNRAGFNVYDIDDEDADILIAEIEQECAKSFMEFLAAVDAERGKDAVGWMWQHEDTGNTGVVDQWQIDNGWEEGNPRIHLISPVFLSPTIPEGMALVRSPITEEMHIAAIKALLRAPGINDLPQRMLDAMIQAAGVTK